MNIFPLRAIGETFRRWFHDKITPFLLSCSKTVSFPELCKCPATAEQTSRHKTTRILTWQLHFILSGSYSNASLPLCWVPNHWSDFSWTEPFPEPSFIQWVCSLFQEKYIWSADKTWFFSIFRWNWHLCAAKRKHDVRCGYIWNTQSARNAWNAVDGPVLLGRDLPSSGRCQ